MQFVYILIMHFNYLRMKSYKSILTDLLNKLRLDFHYYQLQFNLVLKQKLTSIRTKYKL